MALTFFPSPSWLHKAFFSPQSLLPPVWELLGKWKEPPTEEEAEIQLMVPNSGRDVSGWKTSQGEPTPTPTSVRQREGCKKILSNERGSASEERNLSSLYPLSTPQLPTEP